MTIKVTYNVTDVYVSETISATYINISYEAPSGGSSVWGGITGTLSNQTDLQNALNAKFDDPTGTTSQYLRGDGTLATFPTIPSGTVTSVGLTMPSAFSVANSPVTSSGTLAVTGAGDTTQYIAGDGSLVAFPIAGQSGTLVREVRNVTGATLTKGTVVYINGASGNKPTVAKALATGDATSAQTFGLIQADIPNNSNGYIVAYGDLDGINTSAFAEGVQLYLSATTAGTYTSVKQYAPNHLVYIGVVTRQHVNQGRIEVRIQNGYELDEIHNVSAQTPTNNDGLFYNSTNSLWENKSIATALGYTPISGTGTSGQVAYFTGATTQAGSNNLFWDTTNLRLGIRTSSPTYILDLESSIINSTRFKNNSTTSALLSAFHNSGNTGLGILVYGPTYAAGTAFSVGANGSTLYSDGAAPFAVGTNVAQPLLLGTNATERMRLDASGNLGLGVVPSAWSGSNGLQIGFVGSLNGRPSGSGIYLSSNVYFVGDPGANGANARYIQTTTAGSYAVIGNNHYWFTAPSGTINTAITWTIPMTLYSTGNLAIGSSASDSGQRLQVTGDTLLKGSGNTSATTALTVQNSDASSLFRVLNQGFIRLGNAGATSPAFFTITTGFSSNNLAGTNFSYYNYTTTESAVNGSFAISGEAFSSISAKQINIYSLRTFAPTSGTAAHDNLNISSTINQTGGANGITRGLYIQPTLTAAADWRSIEWSNNSGWGLYGAGTANNYMAGSLGIGQTTLTGSNLRISKAHTGSASAINFYIDSTIQSDVTNSPKVIATTLSTQAAAFTVARATHYLANQGTIGAGSTITTQVGFEVDNTLIGATINYGFFGNIASGTNRWNLYMNGTAANYLNGSLLIGSTTDSGEKLQVTGTMKVTGASSFGGNISLSLNQNNNSELSIINTTSGTSSQASLRLQSSSGSGAIGKYSATTTAFKTISATDFFVYNTTGDIAILNDNASGNIKFAAGGSSTTQMLLNASGNLGLGVTNQSERLQIAGNILLISGYNLYGNSTSGNYSRIELYNASTGNMTLGTYFATASMLFLTNGTERMRINAAGNLLIGSTTDSGEKLQVTGTAKITSKLSMGAGTTSNAQINLASSTAPTTPNDGDIWFDGTDLKMRIGGVTKTFTLI